MSKKRRVPRHGTGKPTVARVATPPVVSRRAELWIALSLAALTIAAYASVPHVGHATAPELGDESVAAEPRLHGRSMLRTGRSWRFLG